MSARTTRHLIFWLALVLLGCDSGPMATAANQVGSGVNPKAIENSGAKAKGAPGPSVPFSDAEVFFEYNVTANDLGFQIFLDADGWDLVSVSGPQESEIVDITAKGPLAELGITELRFESAEPSPAQVLGLFPAGHYYFLGQTVDGATLTASAKLSHSFLAAPTFSPSHGQVVDPDNAVVTWNAPGAELVEVIIESDELPHVFDVTVSGSTTSLTIPPQFLAPGTEYKIEVLAIGANHNRTIVESTFVTMP
jgi:hypothetical protein